MRLGLIAMLAATLATPLAADELRYFEQGGITYRDRVATVKVPVAETQYQDQQVTVCRENFSTQLVDQSRRVTRPVTEYRWEQRSHGWWPFSQPHVAWHYVPHTRYETRVETTKVPVNVRQYVPETRTVKVPQTSVKLVEQPRVVERVAMTPVRVPVGPWGTTPQFATAPTPAAAPITGPVAAAPRLAPAPANLSLAPPPGAPQNSVLTLPPRIASPYTAPREQIGGISRLDADPVRIPATNAFR